MHRLTPESLPGLILLNIGGHGQRPESETLERLPVQPVQGCRSFGGNKHRGPVLSPRHASMSEADGPSCVGATGHPVGLFKI